MPLGEEPQSPRLSHDFIMKPQAQPGQSTKGTGRRGAPLASPALPAVLEELSVLRQESSVPARCPSGPGTDISWPRASAGGISYSRTLCPQGTHRGLALC